MEEKLQQGDYLDNFEIEAVLYSGAMAQVYKALDLLSGETVALKVPFGDILNNRILYYHFQNEERISRFLNHPRIVRFIARDRTRQYTVMEYIPGQDVRTLLVAEKVFPPGRARDFAVQIAEGLEYLHHQEIIHLDIKPENLMVTAGNDIKILDFGLAHKRGGGDLLSEDFTKPHGTPHYIAPEQIEGHRNDPRSDLYSLGLILYEFLTGRLPFPRSSRLSKVKTRLKHDPVPPRHYDETIPPAIQEIILKSLARNPKDRYPSAAALKADLMEYEKVSVTREGLKTDKPARWRSIFQKPVRFDDTVSGQTDYQREVKTTHPHLIGTIIDHEISDLVIEKIKRQALVSGAGITLLTVVEEDTASDFTRYKIAVEGENFRRRIDRYVKLLRRYNIDPLVRIRQGDAAKVIVGVAETIPADLIVLGPTRKKGLNKIFGGSKIDNVIKNAPCNVVVAKERAFDRARALPLRNDLSRLTPAQLVEIDLFLIDAWVHHVNWLSDLTHTLLRNPRGHVDIDEQHCPFGKWIEEMRGGGKQPDILGLVDGPHHRFHELSGEMAACAKSGNMNKMRRVYIEKALPQSSRIRKSLQQVSTFLREQAALKAAGLSSLPGRNSDPQGGGDLRSGNPDATQSAIHDYFIRHPDASPNACLTSVNRKKNKKTSTEGE